MRLVKSLLRTLMDESRTVHLLRTPSSPAPESKVARRAQLCAFHWVQGSPLPPAAQAISSPALAGGLG